MKIGRLREFNDKRSFNTSKVQNIIIRDPTDTCNVLLHPSYPLNSSPRSPSGARPFSSSTAFRPAPRTPFPQ